MFGYLLLLFISIPLLELYLLLRLADATSPLFTFGLVVATGILGASLARWQGVRTLLRIQQEVAAGRMPGEPLIDALMIFMAGALLLTPGLLTDLFGFSLLVPWCRRGYQRLLGRYFQSRPQFTFRANSSTSQMHRGWGPLKGEVVDGDVVDSTASPETRDEPVDPADGE